MHAQRDGTETMSYIHPVQVHARRQLWGEAMFESRIAAIPVALDLRVGDFEPASNYEEVRRGCKEVANLRGASITQ